MLLQVIALRGLLFETADTDEINYRKQLRDAMFQAIGDPRFAFVHHLVRRPIEARLEADHGDRFSRRLDEMWQSRLAGRRLFANDLYLTVIRRPLEGRVGILSGLRDAIFGSNKVGPSLSHEIRQLDIAETQREALRGQVHTLNDAVREIYRQEKEPKPFHQIVAAAADALDIDDAVLRRNLGKMANALMAFPVAKTRPFFDAMEKAASILCVDCTAKMAGRFGISSGTSMAKRPR